MTDVGDFAQSRGDVMRRLHELEQLVKRMRAERRLEAATIGRGGIRIKGGHLQVEQNGDIVVTGGGGVTVSGGGGISVGDGGEVFVDDGGNVVVRTPGDLLLQDPDGSTVWQASTAPIRTDFADADGTGLSIPTTWTVLGFDTIPVPAGHVGDSHFIAMASCGDTMTDTGSVSVAVAFRFNYTDGTSGDWFSGPAVASPDNRIAVATSMWASNFALTGGAKPVASVALGAWCVRSFGTEDPGTGNFHVSGSLIFRRG